VLEVNKRGDDQAGQEQRINQDKPHRLPAKGEPAAQEGHRRQQLDQEIADGNACAAVAAFPAQKEPGDQGMFRYHGIEYLQCGQWEGGDTMLCPSGRR